MTPLEMAHAYNTLAAGGQRISGSMASSAGGPLGILDVYDGGDCIDEGGTDCYQQGDPVPDGTGANGVNKVIAKPVIDAGVAEETRSILSTVVSEGTGHLAQTSDPTWGKTGTTDDNGDAWFCGATPKVTACVWVGFPDTVTPMETEFGGAPVDGGTFPALIFSRVIDAYDAILASRNEGEDVEASTDEIDSAAGGAPATATEPTDTSGAVESTEPSTESAPAPETEESSAPEAPAEDAGGDAGAGTGRRARGAVVGQRGRRLAGLGGLPLPGRNPRQRAGEEVAAGGAEAPRQLGGLADPDPRAGGHVDLAPRPGARPELERGAVEPGAVVIEADPDRVGELAGAGAELAHVRAPAAAAHEVDPPGRLERADEDRGGAALGLADGVQQAVDAVGEVDVGAARRAEERRGARREPDVGVARRVVALVALGLDDHSAHAVDQELTADEVARDLVHRPLEEGRAQGAHRSPARSSARTAPARSSCSSTRTAAVPPADSFESSQLASRRTS